MLPLLVVEVREYIDRETRSPYGIWFDRLNAQAAKVATALTRLAAGNFSNVKGVYRIYFGKDGETLVILVGGGTKKRQQHDIGAALAYWQEYKRRKQEESDDGPDS